MLCGLLIKNTHNASAQVPNPTVSCFYKLVDNIVPELNPIRTREYFALAVLLYPDRELSILIIQSVNFW